MPTFARLITTVDSHTAGQSTRLVTAGLPTIHGATLAEKLAYAARHLPWLPGLVLGEPRGHRNMFGAVLVPPCDPGADAGVLFMDNQGFAPMCGHGLIGVVTCLLETGVLPAVAPLTTLVVETASGLVRAYAQVEGDRVVGVTFENTPAFVYSQDVSLALPGYGELVVDIAFGGNFILLVDATQIGLELVPANAARLATLGAEMLRAANVQAAVRHPEFPHLDRIVDVRFYVEPGSAGADSRNVVVLGDHMVDRSPCGTGTCAELALRHARGQLRAGQPWVVESIIGTRFTGEIVVETSVGQGAALLPAIIPRVTGSAYITGFCQWALDPRDPFPTGFSLDLTD